MPQPKLHWSAYLWPGLPQLWTRGSWAALALAVGFTALANLLASAVLVWTEWLSREIRLGAAGAMSLVWLLAWLEARADWRRLLAEYAAGASTEYTIDWAERGFREAQAAYLTGDWVAAEQVLLKLLKHDGRDAEARLMLATLWRHEGRLAAAAEQLDQLGLLETGAAWKNEIAWERERIAAASVENHDDAEASAASASARSDEPEIATQANTSRLAA